ncbi:MAG: hypothetical protein SFW35_00910 [Chitinophagales bacterium]|nr:hypothetical protein [Chitinophagales bacterium]
MSNAITVVSTWTTEHMAEIFLKPIFTAEDIVSTYAIDPTVNRSKTISLAASLNHILQLKTDCGFSPSGSFALGEKTISTQPCAVNLEQCASEFYDTVFKQNLKRGSDIYDLGGTVMEKVMIENVTNALRNDIFELCWFGNTAHSTTFYKTFDGWFKLFNGHVNTVTIGSTALNSGDAVDILKEMYLASNPLRSVKPSEKVFLVTDSLYNNLLETFEGTALDSGLARLAEDAPVTFRGIPVEPQLTWDVSIAAQNLSNPHRAVYTKRENLLIGTDIKRPGSDAKLFLDELTEKFYFKANFDLGVQYLFDEYIVYAK